MIWREKPVGLALVGCGNMGAVHAKAIRRSKRARLVSVYDAEGARAKAFAADFAVTRVAETYERLLEDAEVEGVLLATPHHLHVEQTLSALDAGKHVFVEKPMALTGDDSRRMCERAAERNRRLLVGHIMRFWPNVQKAREAIRAGTIGEIRHISRRRLVYQKDAGRAWAHDPVQAGGWLIQGITVHEVDALLYLANLEISEVLAVTNTTNPIWGDIDELSALIKFAGGAIGSLVHTLNCHVTGLETVIVGTRGSIVLNDWHRKYTLNGETAALGDDDGTGGQLHEFIQAIRKGAESRIDGPRILPTMTVLDSLRDCVAKRTTNPGEPTWRCLGTRGSE